MKNYRPENPEAMMLLRKNSVTVADKIATHCYGQYAHIMDIEGNKIELWEPNSKEFENPGEK